MLFRWGRGVGGSDDPEISGDADPDFQYSVGELQQAFAVTQLGQHVDIVIGKFKRPLHALGFERAHPHQELGAYPEPWKSITIFDEHQQASGSLHESTKSADREACPMVWKQGERLGLEEI